MKKIMLLGAAGQMGQAIQYQERPADWEIMPFTRDDFDLTDRNAVRNTFLRAAPDLVINAAAMANVDEAEKNEEAAMAINFHAPANLAALCSSSDVPMIHLSTDYVFDGGHLTPYLPDDPINPLNIYGKTKFLGEEAVRQELAWHVVLRISSVFSPFGKNMLTNTLRWIEEKDEIQVVNDQIICPTYAGDVAEVLVKIGSEILNGKANGFGLFQYCGETAINRYNFVQTVMDAYRPHTTRRPKITPTSSDSFAHLARRPAYSAMDAAKLHRLYGIEQKDWRKGLKASIERLAQQKKESGA